ncbi:MAG: YlxR family protein [Fimbriimonas sp.]
MPERTCVACRLKTNQSDLIRVGISKSGAPGIWIGLGRSLYVCPTDKCVEDVLKKGRLERAFRRPFSDQDRQTLRTELICQLR